MSIFIGTEEEYHRQIGPRIRNKVQSMTKSYRRGACQHCGVSGETIEAAHVHGKERKQIIHEVIEKNWNGKEYILNLEIVEDEIVAAHKPIEEAFLFLCSKCHRKYDANQSKEKGNVVMDDQFLRELMAEYEVELQADDVDLTSGNNGDFKKIVQNSENLDCEHSDFSAQSQEGNEETGCFKSDPIIFNEIRIETCKRETELFQDFVKRTLRVMFSQNLFTSEELNKLQTKEYSKRTLGLEYPLFQTDANMIRDRGNTGIPRYWTSEKFGQSYYACSQWWKGKLDIYEPKFAAWIKRIVAQKEFDMRRSNDSE